MSSHRARRPLGHTAYGSTPHLPGSQTGARDRTVPAGQARMCARPGARDRVIVTEKLDGSCTAIWHSPSGVVALGRRGDLAVASRSPIRRAFASWVERNSDRFLDVLPRGSWLVGEWLLVAHGTRYDLSHEPWVPFAWFASDEGEFRRRRSWDSLLALATRAGLTPPDRLHDAVGLGLSIEDAELRLGRFGHHGAIDPAEGAVWLIERDSKPVLTAKYVRPSARRGRYLFDHTGMGHVLNPHCGQTVPVAAA